MIAILITIIVTIMITIIILIQVALPVRTAACVVTTAEDSRGPTEAAE